MKLILLAVASCALTWASCTRELVVEVTNPTGLERIYETVEIPWAKVESALPGVAPQEVVVLTPDGDTLPCQAVTLGEETPQSLIFQISLIGDASEKYQIRKGRPAPPTPQVFGRLVPERMDDFAWENNLIGFRMYGPALQATGEISNGIDIWQKRTRDLVVDKWYKNGDYHTDHGEGLDCYKVGRTLGAGAMAPYLNDTVWLGNNFVESRILDNGPIRITFELTYAPYRVGDRPVTEKRIISLDANTRFNRVTEIYDRSMEAAAGIVLRDGGERMQDGHCIAYWEPAAGNDGNTGIGVVFPEGIAQSVENCGHLLALTSVKANEPFTYYTGAGWSKAGTEEAKAWFEEVKNESARLAAPLVVDIR